MKQTFFFLAHWWHQLVCQGFSSLILPVWPPAVPPSLSPPCFVSTPTAAVLFSSSVHFIALLDSCHLCPGTVCKACVHMCVCVHKHYNTWTACTAVLRLYKYIFFYSALRVVRLAETAEALVLLENTCHAAEWTRLTLFCAPTSLFFFHFTLCSTRSYAAPPFLPASLQVTPWWSWWRACLMEPWIPSSG